MKKSLTFLFILVAVAGSIILSLNSTVKANNWHLVAIPLCLAAGYLWAKTNFKTDD
jgi:1,4-dihydroxy-2-naphthoate octaprenyltransferase